ncbi:MAG: hypothetical protein JW839_15180 [Candidatus Lokiarchaeota archaeon]|nr:hypothetical protein [Candidatus Lokiarchaeota archaeon]
MSLDEFLKPKKATRAQEGASDADAPDEAGPIPESKPMPDRMKIALLKRLLEEKNLAQGPVQQRLKVPGAAGVAPASEDFVTAFERFADWIRGRKYLRGDIETARQMIANLVLLDRSLMPPSEGGRDAQRFADVADFIKEAKQHDSLHPDESILTKQELAALTKKKQGKPLTSTDYRHLKLLKERVKAALKVVPFHEFLAGYLDVPEY